MAERPLPVITYILENFWLNDSEEFQVSDSIAIRISNEEEEKRAEGVLRFFPTSKSFFLMGYFMDNPQSRIDQWPIWLALFALRLTKAGGVGYDNPFVNPRGYRMTSWRADNRANFYVLESNEIPTVQRIYGQLVIAIRDVQFTHILRRFNASYNGPFYKRLEDLMASLEALLIFDRKIQRKNAKIQERLELLIGSQVEDPDRMRNTMHIAYTARNYILHEARILDSELMKEVSEELRIPVMDVFNLVWEVEEYARKGIRTWGAKLSENQALDSSSLRKEFCQNE